MKYDSVKNIFAKTVSKNTFLRKIFYMLLDLMFLRSWHVRREIKSLLNKDDNVCIYDAGMGFGQYDYFLAKCFKNCKILGVDVKEEQVNDCNYFFGKCGFENVFFKTENLLEIEYENKFDFILSVDVMEHIHEDQIVLNNFYKALKNSGKILINTPSDMGGSDTHSHEDESFIEEHARNGYSKEEITAKLKKAGFNNIKVKYSYGKFGSFSWKLGIKYPISIVGKSKLFVLLLPFYYLFTLIPVLFLMCLDVSTVNEKGTGILVTAEKISG
ncbi:MAG: methyltransferase domain-containing protein [Ignavibacteria bacterium]|nr:methyltransferase domain-containing protein [Ignavibacteria bacterium]